MYDILPFPRIMGGTAEEQVGQIIDYLTQFKETLEFALTNIDTDNLSQDLVKKLNDLGADIEKSKEERENEVGQITNKALTIYDVVNSDVFKNGVSDQIPKAMTFVVNFDTGELEYAVHE